MAHIEEIIFQTKGSEQVVAASKAVGQSATEAGDAYNTKLTPSTAKAKSATEALTGAIRAERQENRIRNFAVREGAGAIGELSNIMVGPSGLTKAITTGTGKLFEMDFALKAMGDVAETKGGIIGKLGGMIGGIALPVSIAVGAFALIKEQLDADEKKYNDNVVAIKKLKEELGIIKVDALIEIDRSMANINKEGAQISGWSMLWRSSIDKILGTTYAIGYAQAQISDQEKKTLELEKQRKEIMDKLDEISIRTAATVTQNTLKEIELSDRSAKQKISDSEKVEFRQLQAEENVALFRAKSGEETKRLQEEFAAKRIALELRYTEAFKNESEQRKKKNEEDLKEIQRQNEEQRKKENAAMMESFKADQDNQMLKLQLAKDTLANQGLAKEEFIRKSAELDLLMLNEEEETALGQLRNTEGLYADLSKVQDKFAIKRQILAQQTETKVRAESTKTNKHMKDDFNDIEMAAIRMSENLSKSATDFFNIFSSGFSSAIMEGIKGTKSFEESFRAMAEKIIEKLIEMIIEAMIFNIVMGFLTGGVSTALSTAVKVPGLSPEALALAGHQKGADFIVPPGFESDNFPLGFASSGERVKITPSKDVASATEPQGTIVNINFNSPVPHGDWIKKSVEEGLRATGLTVNKYFVNQRKSVSIG